jgi:hypothetical protein
MTAVKPIRPRTERPNTVAGLEAKKEDLVRLRDQLEADLRSVTSDIDHLDAAILLFSGARQHERYVRRHPAKKGSVRCFVLNMLRDTDGPVTTKMLTDAWCAARPWPYPRLGRLEDRRRAVANGGCGAVEFAL